MLSTYCIIGRHLLEPELLQYKCLLWNVTLIPFDLMPLTKSTLQKAHIQNVMTFAFCSIAVCAADTGQLHWSAFHHWRTLFFVSLYSLSKTLVLAHTTCFQYASCAIAQMQ